MNITFNDIDVYQAKLLIAALTPRHAYDFTLSQGLNRSLGNELPAKKAAKSNGKAREIRFDPKRGHKTKTVSVKKLKYRAAYKALGSYSKAAKKHGVTAASIWTAVNR